jgi:hypothetical protein
MRQFSCIEITRTDALLLRDAIRPLAKVEPFEPRLAMQFCEKLYEALLKMKAHDLEEINIPLEEQEVMFINQFVSNDDWANSLNILEQSWLALHELRNKRVYPRPEADAETSIQRVLERAQQ